MNTSTDGLSIVAEALGVSVKNGGREKKLLDGITFTVEPGEFICVLGPEGFGHNRQSICAGIHFFLASSIDCG